jgi:hypothetical protein
MKGKGSVVAGSRMNKVQAIASELAPDALAARMQGKQTEPGSGSS